MQKLGLLYNNTVIISIDNCRFGTEVDLEKDFPGEGELRIATLSCEIPYGSGAEVPQSFDDFLESNESSDNLPQILNSKPAPGVADALRALKRNEFNSYFSQNDKYGATNSLFHKKKFRDKVSKKTFRV